MTDLYELGADDSPVPQSLIDRQKAALTKLNDALYSALATYKVKVGLGKWGLGLVGYILYSADDPAQAQYDVDNWHTGALKWQTDGANALLEGKITEAAWVDWGLRLAKNAEEIGAKLADSGILSRAKSFAEGMPAAMKKVLGKGLGSIIPDPPGGGSWKPWIIGGGALAGLFLVTKIVMAVREK
jgi:hypothetical protein